MQEYIIELSKYFISLLMVLYTLLSFLALRHKPEEHHKGFYAFQSLLIFAIQLLCFLNLALVSRNIQYVFFYAFTQIFLFAAIMLSKAMPTEAYSHVSFFRKCICVSR